MALAGEVNVDGFTKPLEVSIVRPGQPMTFDNDEYKLPCDSKGHALIVNVTEFDEPSLNRRGAKHDTAYMNELWRGLGYNTDSVHENNVTANSFKIILDEFRKKLVADVASCVVYIGSHGRYPDKILLSDMTTVDLYTDIVYQFDKNHCPEMNGDLPVSGVTRKLSKPKLFFIQACRTERGGTGTSQDPTRISTDKVLLPLLTDTIVCYSTMPKMVSYRKGYGSFFTYYLAFVFMKNAHCKSLHDLLQQTAEEVVKFDGKYSDSQKNAQISTYKPYLLDATKLYFNMKPEPSAVTGSLGTKILTTSKIFSKVPHDLQDFMDPTKSSEKSVLVLLTLDVSMTTRKIEESLKGSKKIDIKGFLDLDPEDSANKSVLHYVVADELQEVEELAEKCQEENLMVVVVIKDVSADKKKNLLAITSVKLTNDEMRWADLHIRYQRELRKCIEEQLKIKVDSKDLTSAIHGQTLLDIMNGKRITLFENSLPVHLPYYVSRTHRSRNVISMKILKVRSSNIFLFSGVTRSELSNLVDSDTTEDASEIVLTNVKEINCRFIVLDNEKKKAVHFHKIVEKTTEPVHWLSVKMNGALKWVQSSGDVSLLQRFVDFEAEQTLFSEEAFFENLERDSSAPVCIVDSPGMGKTVLLAEIGRTLKRKCPERDVIFLRIAELVREVRNFKESGQDMVEAISKAVEKLGCESDLERVCLQHRLNSRGDEGSGPLMELLLDGLDEVDTEVRSLTEEVLQTIQSSFKTTRVWVTSRPHLLHHLEKCLSTLGYNILPFTDENQLNFLTSYWIAEKVGERGNQRLHEFAESCLKTLRLKLSLKDAEITGIPLQCFLIGVIYKEQAENYVETASAPNSLIQLNSIWDLYRSLVETKLKKYRDINGDSAISDKEIIGMHQKLSLDTLFPKHGLFSELEVKIGEVLKVGLVEVRGEDEDPRFLHRTIPEFLVARLVITTMKNRRNYSDQFQRLLYRRILATWNGFIQMVPHFIDAMLNDSIPIRALVNSEKGILQTFDVRQMLQASVISSYPNILKRLLKECSSRSDVSLKRVIDSKLLQCSACQSNLETFKLTLTQFQITFPDAFDFKSQERVLGLAVQNGHFSIVEYLLNKCDLRDTCSECKYESKENGIEITGMNLLHKCVTDSNKDDDRFVQERLLIIRRLHQIDKTFISSKDSRKRTPLLSSRVHPKLVFELIDLGADPFHKDGEGNTVLHLYGDGYHMTEKEYLQLLRRVLPSNWNESNPPGAIPVNCDDLFEDSADIKETGTMVRGRSPPTADLNQLEQQEGKTITNYRSEELVSIIVSEDVENVEEITKRLSPESVNATDEFGNSPLHFAAKISASFDSFLKVIKCLIDNGCDVYSKNSQNWTFLQPLVFHKEPTPGQFHSIAVLLVENGYGDIFNVKVGRKDNTVFMDTVNHIELEEETISMLKSNGVDINAVNRQGWNALASAYAGEKSLEFLSLLVKLGVRADKVDNDGWTLLHHAAGHGKEYDLFGVTKLLVENGVDVNAKDNVKWTALDRAVKKKRSLEYLQLLVELGGGWASVRECHPDMACTTAASGTLEALEYFLQLGGIDVMATDKDGDSPLHLAVWEPEAEEIIEKVKLLLYVGFYRDALNKNSQTPMFVAANKDHSPAIKEELFKLLEEDRLSPVEYAEIFQRNARDCSKELINAIKEEDVIKVKEILEGLSPQEISANDNFGNTALHLAVMTSSSADSCLEIVTCLVKNGCDVFARNYRGLTFLQPLLRLRKPSPSRFHDLVKELLGKGHGSLFSVQFGDETTVFQDIIYRIEPNEETLGLLSTVDLPINEVNGQGLNCLAVAISGGRSLTTFSRLVEMGADTSCVDEDGWNLLHYAAFFGREDDLFGVTRLLVEKEVSVNAKNHAKWSALDRAVKKKRSLEYLELLVELGGGWGTVRESHSDIACTAAGSGTLEALEYFLQLGGLDVGATDNDGDTALHFAVWEPESESVVEKVKLLLYVGFDRNAVNKAGETPSDVAEKKEHYASTKEELLKLLGEEGLSPLDYFEIFQRNAKNCSRELINAISEGDVKKVEEIGVNFPSEAINMIDSFGNSALHLAAMASNEDICLEIIQNLIDSGCDVFAKNCQRWTFLQPLLRFKNISPKEFHTLLEQLVRKGHGNLFNLSFGDVETTVIQDIIYRIEPAEETLTLLSTQDIDLNKVNENGLNCITAAISGGRSLTTFSRLVEMGADANFVDEDGWTLLHHVASFGKESEINEITKLLVDLGVGMDVTDENGWTVFDRAVKRKRDLSYFQLLVELGGGWEVVREYSSDIACIIARFGTLEALRYFLQLGGVDENATINGGNTALHQTVRGRRTEDVVEKVKLLLYVGADRNARNKDGDKPHEIAEKGGHSTLLMDDLRQLLGEEGLTSFDCATIFQNREKETISSNYMELINKILEGNHPQIAETVQKCSIEVINERDDFGNSLLHFTSMVTSSPDSCFAILKCIVDNKCNLNEKNSQGRTFFQSILRFRKSAPHIFRAEVEYAESDDEGNTIVPVKTSSDFEMEDETTSLLSLENNMDCESWGEWNVLAAAIIEGRSLRFLSFLIDLGVNVKCTNSNGWTLLHWASHYGKECHLIGLTELLVDSGVKANELDNNGWTALMMAVERNRGLDYLKVLVRLGGDWSIARNYHFHLISVAAMFGTPEALKYILELGVDVNETFSDGNSALHSAVKYSNEEIVIAKVKLLRNFGAICDAANNDGDTPYNIAEKCGHSALIMGQLKKLLL